MSEYGEKYTEEEKQYTMDTLWLYLARH
ncbi:hypothetical protein GWP28_10315 [Corynebacterium macginleyi]|nr:hypothetical protein [Corynebacterium macginleyi]